MKSHDSDHAITRCHVSNCKLNISSATGPILPDMGGDIWWQEVILGVTWIFDYAVLSRNIKVWKQKFQFICEN